MFNKNLDDLGLYETNQKGRGKEFFKGRLTFKNSIGECLRVMEGY